MAEELSHYSNGTSDIEYRFPFGWGELWGVANRTDFDLKAHMKEQVKKIMMVASYQFLSLVLCQAVL